MSRPEHDEEPRDHPIRDFFERIGDWLDPLGDRTDRNRWGKKGNELQDRDEDE